VRGLCRNRGAHCGLTDARTGRAPKIDYLPCMIPPHRATQTAINCLGDFDVHPYHGRHLQALSAFVLISIGAQDALAASHQKRNYWNSYWSSPRAQYDLTSLSSSSPPPGGDKPSFLLAVRDPLCNVGHGTRSPASFRTGSASDAGTASSMGIGAYKSSSFGIGAVLHAFDPQSLTGEAMRLPPLKKRKARPDMPHEVTERGGCPLAALYDRNFLGAAKTN
jgi:hypothetical protein